MLIAKLLCMWLMLQVGSTQPSLMQTAEPILRLKVAPSPEMSIITMYNLHSRYACAGGVMPDLPMCAFNKYCSDNRNGYFSDKRGGITRSDCLVLIGKASVEVWT